MIKLSKSVNDIGEVYREIRLRRGLAIKQVKQRLDSSAVSHFERDNSDIRVSNLMMLLRPTLMDVDEFTQLIEPKGEILAPLFSKISDCYDRTDVDGLRTLLAEFSGATQDNAPSYLVSLVIKSYLAELERTDPRLSASDAEFVEAYLLKDGRWFGFEYIVFANLSYGLSSHLNNRLLSKMIREYESFHLSHYTDFFMQTFYNLSVLFLERGDYQNAENAVKLVDGTPTSSRFLYIKHHVAFLKLVLAWLKHQDDIAIRQQIQQFTAVTKTIDADLYQKNLAWLASLGYEMSTLSI